MRDIPIISLILANLIPLFGVLFLSWDPTTIIFTYWLENVVIGFYNILKMLKAASPTAPDAPPIIINIPWRKKPLYTRTKRAFVLMFIFFYGTFTAVYGVAILSIFQPFTLYFTSITIAVFSLFISHGISYARNFIGKEEYKRVTPDSLMFQPLKRVFFMQVVVMIGSFTAEVFGTQTLTLAVLVFLKIFVDLLTHRYFHVVIARLPSQMPEQLENLIKSRLNPGKLSEEETKNIQKLMNNAFQLIVKKIKNRYGKL